MRLTPYLLLPNSQKRRVQKVLEEHALDEDTLQASIVLLEEMGDEFPEIRRALYQEEHNGVMRPGTYYNLVQEMKSNPSDVDWRTIPRRGRQL